jgi:hypothetical protein
MKISIFFWGFQSFPNQTFDFCRVRLPTERPSIKLQKDAAVGPNLKQALSNCLTWWKAGTGTFSGL